MTHWQCKYCDRPAGYMGIPINVDGELICACGAEWADAKFLIETTPEEDEELLRELESYKDEYYDDEWTLHDDLLSCGCCSCCGCTCWADEEEDIDDFDEMEAWERKATEEW